MTPQQVADILEQVVKILRAIPVTATPVLDTKPHQPQPVPSIESDARLCVSIKEGARILNISVSAFKRLNFKKVKVGHLTRYRINTIKDYLDKQEREAGL